MDENIKDVTDDTFDTDVLKATSPSSSTSGPRGAARAGWSPRSSRRSAEEHGDKISIVKMNTDENPGSRATTRSCRSRP